LISYSFIYPHNSTLLHNKIIAIIYSNT